MVGDGTNKNKLEKAKSFNIQAINSNIISRGLSDLDRVKRENAEEYDRLIKSGINYQLNGELEEALDCYDKALKIKPFSTALLLRTYILHFLGRQKEALECCENLTEAPEKYEISAATQKCNVWSLKGDILFIMNRYSDALDCYDNSLALNISPSILTHKGLVLNKLERYEEALTCCNRACFCTTTPRPIRPISIKTSR